MKKKFRRFFYIFSLVFLFLLQKREDRYFSLVAKSDPVVRFVGAKPLLADLLRESRGRRKWRLHMHARFIFRERGRTRRPHPQAAPSVPPRSSVTLNRPAKRPLSTPPSSPRLDFSGLEVSLPPPPTRPRRPLWCWSRGSANLPSTPFRGRGKASHDFVCLSDMPFRQRCCFVKRVNRIGASSRGGTVKLSSRE